MVFWTASEPEIKSSVLTVITNLSIAIHPPTRVAWHLPTAAGVMVPAAAGGLKLGVQQVMRGTPT